MTAAEGLRFRSVVITVFRDMITFTRNLIGSINVSEKSKASIFRVEEWHSVTGLGDDQTHNGETHIILSFIGTGLYG
jgi:hypothetical protein